MYARASEFRVLPGKLYEFTSAIQSILPELRQQAGFRAMIVLGDPEQQSPEATVISVWDSHADLEASEKNMFLYQALSRILSYCEGFPKISAHRVLASEFAAD
jgi:quinol monooxygenase YgiN